MTYGAETWTLTAGLVHQFKVAQRAMERAMLGVSLKDRIRNDVWACNTLVILCIIHVSSRFSFLCAGESEVRRAAVATTQDPRGRLIGWSLVIAVAPVVRCLVAMRTSELVVKLLAVFVNDL
ncbi:hypothetical protein evm_013823 [Chilo suppressalis]|nr:hypothetical protein evm_013823 [Chilo suppressalis]